jgi:hypothetical protein
VEEKTTKITKTKKKKGSKKWKQLIN